MSLVFYWAAFLSNYCGLIIMYFFTVSFLFLIFYFFSKERVINTFLFVISPVLLSFICINIYFNGGDWINYYSMYHNADNFSSPELLFFAVLDVLRIIAFNDFSISIFLYFLTCFSFIALFFYLPRYRKLTGEIKTFYLFISLLFFIVGPTLVIEQLRQFASLIFLMYAYGEYHNRNKPRFILFTICAVLCHISAFMFPIFLWVASQRLSKNKFLCLTFLLLGILLVTLQASPTFLLLSNIPLLVYLGDKISFYLTSVDELRVGIRQVLFVLFIFVYYFKFNEDNMSVIDRISMRIFTLGCSLFLISSFVPSIERLFYCFLFVYILFVTSYVNRNNSLAFKKIIILYSFIIFSFFPLSYYNDKRSPLYFAEGENFIFDVVSQKVDYKKLISPIMEEHIRYLENKGNTNK